jgi:hypothetical protein
VRDQERRRSTLPDLEDRNPRYLADAGLDRGLDFLDVEFDPSEGDPEIFRWDRLGCRRRASW